MDQNLLKKEKLMYAHECIIMPVTKHCRASTQKTTEFRSKLAFSHYYVTLTKEQSLLKSVMDAFEREYMQTQNSVLGYRFDLYFHDYKLAI